MTIEKDSGIGPPGYHQLYYSDRDWSSYSGLLSKVITYSRPGLILDLGAGCGFFIEAAARWGVSSIGLEGSSEAVDIAKKRSPEIDIRLHRLSDILPFESGFFQTVILNQVVEHLEPKVMRQTLQEAYRVLAFDGMILITSPSCFNKEELKADPTHINLLSPRQLRNELAQVGFEDIIEFNAPLPLFGRSRIGYWAAMVLFRLLFKLLKVERLSASANAMAFKRYKNRKFDNPKRHVV